MSGRPPVTQTIESLRSEVSRWRQSGETVALVPTMGALHEGHLSLVRLANEKADRTVVSIFVNPKQFGPREDLATYPRDETGDLKKLHALDTDLVYAPSVDIMYPPDFSTQVEVGGLTEGLCGASRPHFFVGVGTIVSKLLIQCMPDFAMFGEKDYQQLLVVRRMARDLDIPVEIVGGPVIREKDGLAMSSRNAYLTDGERKLAPLLFSTIREAGATLAKGTGVAAEMEKAREALSEAGFVVDYIEVRNAETLEPVTGTVSEPARVFAAVVLGKTRLIDNVPVTRTP